MIMTWYNLVDQYSGRLISDSSVPIVPDRPGVVVIETLTRDGIWNPETRQYDPRPAPDRYIPMRDYLDRFDIEEIAGILNACRTDPILNAHYARLSLLSEIKITGTRTRSVLEGLEAAGILDAGRAEAIING